MAVYTPHPLQIQLELFLVLDLQRLGLLDQFRGDGHALAEGSTRSAPQQATGHVGRRSLAQWGATEILHESPLVDKFGASRSGGVEGSAGRRGVHLGHLDRIRDDNLPGDHGQGLGDGLTGGGRSGHLS